MPTKGAALRAEYAFKQASRAVKLQWCAAGPAKLRGAGSPLNTPALSASGLSSVIAAERAG
jgi:hypothetical protein